MRCRVHDGIRDGIAQFHQNWGQNGKFATGKVGLAGGQLWGFLDCSDGKLTEKLRFMYGVDVWYRSGRA